MYHLNHYGLIQIFLLAIDTCITETGMIKILPGFSENKPMGVYSAVADFEHFFSKVFFPNIRPGVYLAGLGVYSEN